jgi:hydroxymethylpyrimidine pyrophosphatase-like HAD family hydrolase
MKRRIIAVDFDGTCVTHEYPEIGEDVPHAVEVLKRLNEAKVKIIVWTMRHGKHLDEDAVEWFKEKGIEVWAFNENPTQKHWTQSPKAYAQAYIDDAAIGCPLVYPEDGGRPYVDWFAVEKILEEQGYFDTE